jgi:uncharacterized protein (DUF302 family)
MSLILKEKRMKKTLLFVLFIVFAALPLIAAEGMISIESPYSVPKTADRLEGIITGKGMTVFKRISHSEGAKGAGIELRDTELIIFGNPKVGTPLMQCRQSVALDLPQKALIWKDDQAKVWISYNDPEYLKKRHNITGCDEIIAKIAKALAGITKSAAAK